MPTSTTATAKKSPNKAPLIQVDSNELGDKRLNPEEANLRETEALLKMEAKKKIWGQEELEDPERSSGSRMGWTELIRRLQKCNPEIRVRDGSAGSVALYFKKRYDEYTDVDDLILHNPTAARAMNIPVPSDSFFVHHKYITGFEKQPLTEYSHVDLDSSHLATHEHRGWRSVLIALIKARVITYCDAITEFGDPIHDKRSGRWFHQLQNYRN